LQQSDLSFFSYWPITLSNRKGKPTARWGRKATGLYVYVDGQLMKEWKDGIPGNSMKLYTNAWYPIWLEGKKTRTDKFVLIDRIQHVQQ
jgi:hypothetical protein